MATQDRFSVRIDPDPLPGCPGPVELTIRQTGWGTLISHFSAVEAMALSRALARAVPVREWVAQQPARPFPVPTPGQPNPFADIRDDEWDAMLERERKSSPAALVAQRDAARAELAECRALLAMATAFDAGALLEDAPKGSLPKPFTTHHGLYPVKVYRKYQRQDVRPFAEGEFWLVRCGELKLFRDGTWGDWPYWGDSECPPYGYVSLGDALAALNAWRSEARAGIAAGGVGQGGEGGV